MRVHPVLQLAWRRRIPIAVGVLSAVAIGALAGRTAASEQWTAQTRLVLDTPVSQVIDSAPKGADSLAWRAEILAGLATTEPLRARIARDSGVPVGELTVTDPPLSLPLLPATLPRRAATVAAATGTRYTLTAETDGELPFVTLVAQTPDRASATRLVEAARAAVETAATPPPGSGRVQEIVVEQAGEIDAKRQQAAGSGPLRGVLVAVALLTLWCVVVLLAGGPGGVRRARRGAPDALSVAGHAS
jgi:hypothetical protein